MSINRVTESFNNHTIRCFTVVRMNDRNDIQNEFIACYVNKSLIYFDRKIFKKCTVNLQSHNSNIYKTNHYLVNMYIKQINYKEKKRNNGHTIQGETLSNSRRLQRNRTWQKHEGLQTVIMFYILSGVACGWVSISFLINLSNYMGMSLILHTVYLKWHPCRA